MQKRIAAERADRCYELRCFRSPRVVTRIETRARDAQARGGDGAVAHSVPRTRGAGRRSGAAAARAPVARAAQGGRATVRATGNPPEACRPGRSERGAPDASEA